MKYKYSFMTYTDHIYNGLPCNPNLRYQKIFHKNKKFQRVLKEILTWTWILQEMMVFFFYNLCIIITNFICTSMLNSTSKYLFIIFLNVYVR